MAVISPGAACDLEEFSECRDRQAFERHVHYLPIKILS